MIERVYRDCIIIKDKRQDEDTVYRMMHQALHAYSDQMRMYNISESIIQALVKTVLPTKYYIRDAILSLSVTMHNVFISFINEKH